MFIIFFLIGLIVGGCAVYFCLRNKLKTTIQQDKDTAIHNANLIKQEEKLLSEINSLELQKKQTYQYIDDLKAQAEKAGEQLYNSSIELAQTKLEQEVEKLSQQLETNREEYQKEYLQAMEDMANELNKFVNERNNKILELDKNIKEKQKVFEKTSSEVNAAIEANIRNNEENNKKLFYSLQLPEEQLNDIEKLREVSKLLKDSEPLNKVIWKSYYEKAYTDLINRLLNNTTNAHIGIYKITNKENGMCYIGQSVNLADRLRAHIKAGLGIDSSNNKLYTAMKQYKVENFTYEIIEECKREELNEKERMWIKYFQSERWGYNMTKGNN